jgi:hypothetical protein
LTTAPWAIARSRAAGIGADVVLAVGADVITARGET